VLALFQTNTYFTFTWGLCCCIACTVRKTYTLLITAAYRLT